jgi:8-oxo-dGTP pyrophosphatase MutT (NUDIX family)
MSNWTLSDFREAFSRRMPGILGARGVFAVLVPLVEKDGELCLLYEFRAATLRKQPGECCFPGGRVEERETPLDAALRETWEEIGVSKRFIDVIAPLDVMQDISNRVIHPFLAYLEPEALACLRLNPDEVAEVFLIPLSYLRENPPFVYASPVVMQVGTDFPYEKIGFDKGYPFRGGTEEVPMYQYGHYHVWGLTGRITRWLLDQIEHTAP